MASQRQNYLLKKITLFFTAKEGEKKSVDTKLHPRIVQREQQQQIARCTTIKNNYYHSRKELHSSLIQSAACDCFSLPLITSTSISMLAFVFIYLPSIRRAVDTLRLGWRCCYWQWWRDKKFHWIKCVFFSVFSFHRSSAQLNSRRVAVFFLFFLPHASELPSSIDSPC